MQKLGLIVFLFNRPDHTRRLIESIFLNDLNKIDHLHFYIDGPRNIEEEKLVSQVYSLVREAAKKIDGPIVKVEQSNTNLGLKLSVLNGVSKSLEIVDAAIVLEDDLVLSPYFFDWVYSRLSFLETENGISLSGYTYPNRWFGSEVDLISERPSSWGWVIDKSNWISILSFQERVNKGSLSFKISSLFRLKVPLDIRMMLLADLSGRVNSWAVYYAYYHFLFDKTCLMYSCSMVSNNGFDASGTHCEYTDDWNVSLAIRPPKTYEKNHDSIALESDLFEVSWYKKMKFYLKIVLWLSIQLVSRFSVTRS